MSLGSRSSIAKRSERGAPALRSAEPPKLITKLRLCTRLDGSGWGTAVRGLLSARRNPPAAP